ncbi:MAG: TonB-dependent receptor [Rhodospirillaceae bacterium]|nr:MAG: TonB-dependent receptor [Rhodospirillaceae bacterium]
MSFSMKLMSSVAAITLAASTTAAFAQNQQNAQIQSGGLEEIIVTAQRRSEDLQRVPIAISAFSSVELERRQVTKTLDLVNFVPNMTGSNNTSLGTANTYSLRSLNNTESIPTFDPPVGTYVDDVYISRQNANNFSFFDVERVEILRGPQGTLFGRNTTGGAINVIMRKPQEDFGGFGEVGYGRYNRIEIRGSVDAPINDKVLTKFSAYYNKDDGYTKNLTTNERINDESSKGYRAALRLMMTDDLIWDSSLEYLDTSLTNIANQYDPTTGDRITRSGMRKGKTGTAFLSLLTGEKATWGLHNTAKMLSAISNLQASAGESFNVNFITGFRALGQEFLTDRLLVNTFPTGGVANATDGDYDQFTQEIKANGAFMDGSLKYVAGVFYLYEDNITDFADNNATNATTGITTVAIDRTLRNKTESAAGYAQFDFKLVDELTMTAGIRYTDEKKEVDFQSNVTAPNRMLPKGGIVVPCTAPAGQPLFNPTTGLATNPGTCNIFSTRDLKALNIPTSRKTKIWTPRFAVDYQVMPDVMLFASATKGFKSGGWNARGTNAGTIQPFDPEIVWTYETGLRSDWLDNRLRVNTTGYYMDVSAVQVPAASFNPATGQQVFITGNFADIRNYGVEVEATLIPTDGLNLTLGLGTQHSRYVNPAASIAAQQATCRASRAAGGVGAGSCNVAIVTPTGDLAIPTRAPATTIALGANYAIPVGGDLQIVPSVNARYTKGFWLSGSNQGPNQANGFQPSYWRVNAGVAFENSDKVWSVSAGCENCFGETVITAFLAPVAFLDEPSRWSIRAKYKF